MSEAHKGLNYGSSLIFREGDRPSYACFDRPTFVFVWRGESEMSALRPWMCKALTEEVWLSLREAGICNATDFVVRDREDIAQTCGIAYKDVVSIGRVLLAQFSSFPVSGLQLYSNAISSHAILSTGIASLDELLDGGLYAGELCELTGETASGKSQVCLQCALTVAKVHSHKTVYIDTCGSFWSQKALQFASHVNRQQANRVVEETLSKICCVTAFDIYTLLTVLDDLRSSLKSQTDGQYKNAKLVVIDCIASVCSPILGGQQSDSLALIEQLGQRLKSLATDLGVAVLVTSNLASSLEGERRPSLGKLWAHVPHVRVLLQRQSPVNTLSKFTILKSCRRKTLVTGQLDMTAECTTG